MDSMFVLLIGISVILHETTLSLTTDENSTTSVCIVGAGIAGAASSHFIREMWNTFPNAGMLEINVFEKSDRVGGRLLEYRLSDVLVEAGGTAIHSSNQIMSDLIKSMGLSKDYGANETFPETLGIWDGSKFRFLTKSDESSLQLDLQMGLHYGISPVIAKKLVKRTADDLSHVYQMFDEQISFASPKDMFEALNLFNLSQSESRTYLNSKWINDKYMDEFVNGVSRVNYGQADSINAFVDLVSLAGAGVIGNLYSVEGGNSRLVEKLFETSLANVFLNTSVSHIEQHTSTASLLTSSISEQSTQQKEHFCDSVIIATPIEFTNLNISGKHVPSRKYKITHVTFLIGTLSKQYFDLHHELSIPTTIMTVNDPNIPFRSISVDGQTSNGSFVYKIFSDNTLSDEDLLVFFEIVSEIKRFVWKAYPILKPFSPWPEFVLSNNILYPNSIESAGSCMEIEVIGAKNCAIIAIEKLKGLKKIY